MVPIIKRYKPGKSIPLANVLSVLPRLQPRMYSISSSSLSSPGIVEITVGVVHTRTKAGVKSAGVCSNYLARLEPNKDRARISVRESGLRGPEDLVDTPMVMVGAGTGIAVRID